MALYYGSTKASTVLNVWYSSDDGQYYTDNQTGSTFLQLTFDPYNQASKFLIMATVNGAAGDDASGVVQRYASGSWSEPDVLRGSATNAGFRGSFGDWSNIRAIENKQTEQFTAVFIDQPNVSGTIGYRVRYTCENTGGLWINRPLGTDGGYNTNVGRSTLVVFELGV